jgi:hypothetical protein
LFAPSQAFGTVGWLHQSKDTTSSMGTTRRCTYVNCGLRLTSRLQAAAFGALTAADEDV